MTPRTATVFYEDSFNAGHFLPMVPVGHKCRRQHGHTYRIRIEIGGAIGPDGFVVDYAVVAAAWKTIAAQLDHYNLNDVDGLENPTCENLAHWIGDRLASLLAPGLTIRRLELRETEHAGVVLNQLW